MTITNSFVRSNSLIEDAKSVLPKKMFYPVRGMVLSPTNPDDSDNLHNAVYGKEFRPECSVLVMHGGGGSDSYILNNVVVPSPFPLGAGSDDNYNAFAVKGLTVSRKGKTVANTAAIQNIMQYGILPEDNNSLNGNMVVVQFIGGDRDQPFISGYWPHPLNTVDPNTTEKKSGAVTTLAPHRTPNDSFNRNNGVESLITEDGYMLVNSTAAQDGSMMLDLKSNRDIRICFEGKEYLRITDTGDGVQVALGAAASAPAVVGDILANIFDNHTHTCAVGPTSPPMVTSVSVSFQDPVTGLLVSEDKVADPPIPKKPIFIPTPWGGRVAGSSALSDKIKIPHNGGALGSGGGGVV
jgi:hypothetical protein